MEIIKDLKILYRMAPKSHHKCSLEKVMGDGGGDWNDAYSRPGMLRVESSHQKQGEKASGRNQPW